MATAAYSEYQSSSAIVTSLLSLESQYLDPPAQADRSLVEGLRGGSLVLMVAAFENYLKGSFGESLERINSANPPCNFSRLPIELQVQSVWLGLEYSMKGRPGEATSKRADRLPDVLSVIGRIHSRELISDAVAKTNGNPNSRLVKQIYGHIAYGNPFSNLRRSFDNVWGKPEATTFVEDTLDAIVNKRHVVAHTASITTISRADLATWHKFLNVLVAVLDEALERHVGRLILRAQ